MFERFSMKIVYSVLLLITVVFMIYVLLVFRFDRNRIKINDHKLAQKLYNSNIEALINGSGINNIPNINIISTNDSVNRANDCVNNPVYIGLSGNDNDCIQTCANSSAHSITVNESDDFIFNNNKLKAGTYCSIGPRPECNVNTTSVILTINSVVCRSKYPEIFGGDLGNTIIACNNSLIYDPQNVLWDNANNQPVSPYTTQLTDINERIDSNTYRFVCNFNGTDERKNKYIEHPFNRFHPIKNFCTSLLYAAHPDVQLKYIENQRNYICDCGDFQETRVLNVYDLPQSPCSNIQQSDVVVAKSKRKLTVPYKCFTLFSPISDVGRYLPCPNDQFTRNGSQISKVDIIYTKDLKHLIEHPEYDKMPNNGDVKVKFIKTA